MISYIKQIIYYFIECNIQLWNDIKKPFTMNIFFSKKNNDTE